MSRMSTAELMTVSVFLLGYCMQAIYLFTCFTLQYPIFFKTLNVSNNETISLYTTLYYSKLNSLTRS